MRQVGYLNVGGYLVRDYAPLADRLWSATQVLQRVPQFLDTLTTALGDAVGRPVLEISIEAYSGMARFYRRDLVQAVADSGQWRSLRSSVTPDSPLLLAWTSS